MEKLYSIQLCDDYGNVIVESELNPSKEITFMLAESLHSVFPSVNIEVVERESKHNQVTCPQCIAERESKHNPATCPVCVAERN